MPAQLSLFSADLQPPSCADLEGLLAGPAHLARRGSRVRLSTVLPRPAGWRVNALVTGLDALGLAPEVENSTRGRVAVRTAFTGALADVAARWTRGATTVAPPGLRLDGARLRWWCVAAGYRDELGYVLVLGDGEASWPRVGAALAAAGLPATLVRPRLPGRLEHQAYRVVGRRRLARLAELVGASPNGAAPDDWPSAAH